MRRLRRRRRAQIATQSIFAVDQQALAEAAERAADWLTAASCPAVLADAGVYRGQARTRARMCIAGCSEAQ